MLKWCAWTCCGVLRTRSVARVGSLVLRRVELATVTNTLAGFVCVPRPARHAAAHGPACAREAIRCSARAGCARAGCDHRDGRASAEQALRGTHQDGTQCLGAAMRVDNGDPGEERDDEELLPPEQTIYAHGHQWRQRRSRNTQPL